MNTTGVGAVAWYVKWHPTRMVRSRNVDIMPIFYSKEGEMCSSQSECSCQADCSLCGTPWIKAHEASNESRKHASRCWKPMGAKSIHPRCRGRAFEDSSRVSTLGQMPANPYQIQKPITPCLLMSTRPSISRVPPTTRTRLHSAARPPRSPGLALRGEWTGKQRTPTCLIRQP